MPKDSQRSTWQRSRDRIWEKSNDLWTCLHSLCRMNVCRKALKFKRLSVALPSAETDPRCLWHTGILFKFKHFLRWIMVNHGESIPFRLRHGTNWRPIHRSVLLCWDVFATSAEVCIMDWLGMVCRVLWMHWRDVQYLCDRRLIYTVPYLSQIFSDNNR